MVYLVFITDTDLHYFLTLDFNYFNQNDVHVYILPIYMNDNHFHYHDLERG